MSGKRVMVAAMGIYALALIAGCIYVQPAVKRWEASIIYVDCFEVGGTTCTVEGACAEQGFHNAQGRWVSGNYPGCDHPQTFPAGMVPLVMP